VDTGLQSSNGVATLHPQPLTLQVVLKVIIAGGGAPGEFHMVGWCATQSSANRSGVNFPC
jgi:hypothetical protein